MVDTAKFAKIAVQVEVALSVTQANHVALGDVCNGTGTGEKAGKASGNTQKKSGETQEPRRASFSKRSFRAWLLCVTRRVRWLGKFWYRLEMICTATSVLPVPGGPTTMVRPGCIPDRMARTAQARRKRRRKRKRKEHRNQERNATEQVLVENAHTKTHTDTIKQTKHPHSIKKSPHKHTHTARERKRKRSKRERKREEEEKEEQTLRGGVAHRVVPHGVLRVGTAGGLRVGVHVDLAQALFLGAGLLNLWEGQAEGGAQVLAVLHQVRVLEDLAQVPGVQEGVLEVQGVQRAIGQVVEGGRGGVPVPQENVVQPGGDHRVGGHQRLDGLQDRFEVVFL